MNLTQQNNKRILAVDPANKSFGFVVLEGPKSLIDWGVKTVKENSNTKILWVLENLIDRYQPDALVVEDYKSDGSQRCLRVKNLIRDIQTLGSRKNIPVKRISHAKVKKAFEQYSASTKQQIATAIVSQFPELTPRLPSVRKLWQRECRMMGVFDALAFAISFFHNKKK